MMMKIIIKKTNLKISKDRIMWSSEILSHIREFSPSVSKW